MLVQNAVFVLLSGLAAVQAAGTKITSPDKFGAKTTFGENTIKALIKDIPSTISIGSNPPIRWKSISSEPTCLPKITKCSTTYFGQKYTLKNIKSAKYRVVWHQDMNPRSCDKGGSCTTTTTTSTVDLSSQTTGWNIKVELGGNLGKTPGGPGIGSDKSASLSASYKDERTTSQTVTTTITDERNCPAGHTCYFETATVFVDIVGTCSRQGYIVCDKDYDKCGDFTGCGQWDAWTDKNCNAKKQSTLDDEECTFTVSPVSNNGAATAVSVFEPSNNDRAKADASGSYAIDGVAPVWDNSKIQ